VQRKAFEIPKSLVWMAYQDVRRNRGAPGCDGQTLTDFDRQRYHNLYRIWNRLCSGSYFPPPVREKRIPKDNGKERILGIPTVSDRVAQGAVKRYVEAVIDPSILTRMGTGPEDRPTMLCVNVPFGAVERTGYWKWISARSSTTLGTTDHQGSGTSPDAEMGDLVLPTLAASADAE